MIPKEVQEKIEEPINNIADDIQHVINEARQSLKEGPAKLAFGPGFGFYMIACICSWVLFIGLLAEIGCTWLYKKPLFSTKWLARSTAPLAIFSLFMANLITTLMGFIANLLNVAAGIFKVTIVPGGGFVGITWGSFIVMIVVAIGLRGIHKPTAGLNPLPNFKNNRFTGWSLRKTKGNEDDSEEIAMSYPGRRPTVYSTGA